jgi:hypothetical protein
VLENSIIPEETLVALRVLERFELSCSHRHALEFSALDRSHTAVSDVLTMQPRKLEGLAPVNNDLSMDWYKAFNFVDKNLDALKVARKRTIQETYEMDCSFPL